jgi:hypothetical protein
MQLFGLSYSLGQNGLQAQALALLGEEHRVAAFLA